MNEQKYVYRVQSKWSKSLVVATNIIAAIKLYSDDCEEFEKECNQESNEVTTLESEVTHVELIGEIELGM